MVELRDISIGYGRRVLASGISERFEANTLNAVIGRNGAGKSTLLRVIAGLEQPLDGEILLNCDLGGENGEKIAVDEARIVSFVSTERVRVANLRVWELVALGRMPYTGWDGRLSAADKAIVDEAVAAVGMGGFADKQTETLSDGELQRMMVARALAQDTPLMVLDEPTAFLDFAARREMVELLAGLAHREGKTVIFSSHELDLVKEFADKTLTL